MKNFTFIFLAVMFAWNANYAQISNRCSTMDVFAEKSATDPSFAQRVNDAKTIAQQWLDNGGNTTTRQGDTIVIPVVVHVVFKTAAQNIDDERIFEQIQILNDDYARMNADMVNTPAAFLPVAGAVPVKFVLAKQDKLGDPTTGIDRVETTKSSFTDDKVKKAATGGADAWPAKWYLNLWTCNLGGGLLGYAQFPTTSTADDATDGVVILYKSFGITTGLGNPYDLGRTATHEVGHWLGLFHIWGDASCGDDNIDDTPKQKTSNYGCPHFPHVTCGNGPNGDMFMNYMDYTDDGCMNIFTQDQDSRILSILNTVRASIKTSPGATDPMTTGIHSNLLGTDNFFLYPNPANNNYQIQYNSDKAGEVTVEVRDITGKLLESKVEKIGTGKNIIPMSTNNVSGYLLITLTNGDQTGTRRLMVY